MNNPWKKQSKINPQRENGNRQIANDVYIALISAPLTGADYKIIFAIIHKTWGFGKNSDTIPLRQFVEMTNCSKRNIQRSLKKLQEMRIIVSESSNTSSGQGSLLNNFLFNKHFDIWVFNTSKGDKNGKGDKCVTLTKGDKNGKLRVTKMVAKGDKDGSLPIKRNYTKETIKEKKTTPPLELPSWLKKEDWDAFVEHRKSFKPKMTAHAEKLCLGRLKKLHEQGHDAKGLIEQTIMNGWKSFFPEKQKNNRQEKTLTDHGIKYR